MRSPVNSWNSRLQSGISLVERDAQHEVRIPNADEKAVVVVAGHDVPRQQSNEGDGRPNGWAEQMLAVKSFTHAAQPTAWTGETPWTRPKRRCVP